jgi:hypothetical protein
MKMSLLESLNRNGHRLVDLLTPNPNQSGQERRLAQPLPAIDYTPVNSPGSKQPNVRNAWYRLINTANREVGYTFNCRCGASNPYLYGRYDLRRELEQDRPCCARCTAVIENRRDENGHSIYEQVVNTEKDKDGNVIPVGAYHNLLDILPNRGKDMDEKQRNLVYATLPTWLLVNEKPQAPFAQTGDWGGNDDGNSAAQWDGTKVNGRDAAFASGDPGKMGLF